ncbi:Protoporphyrinogen oxidase [Massarina eburnea CBS 473.64]|uniref:Protoporphyrinogen oxidase n=1 Tax=Massarina eburnea CBS 473.64 TaxID=1395130 RepID=A0A6A6RY87_9PLEO|nr:Protoporphyrinogen oxidase [Massarina eburnea CBS 473.64]
MLLKQHVPLLESTIKRAIAPSLARSCSRFRRYASAAYPENIAVLGGGISGLASAYFVSKEFPNSKITVYEAGKEPGGWIRSRRVDVPGGNVLFEYGARTLRPGAAAVPTAQLIQDLGLVDNVLYTKPTSPGAKKRYIYYPDRLHLASADSHSFTRAIELWQSGLLGGIPSLLMEPFRPQRSSRKMDESIGSFITRRADRRIVQNLVSAVMHGIYAGDVWQLSAKRLLAQAWQLEGQYGSVLKGMYQINSDAQGPGPSMLYHPSDMDILSAIREDFKIEDKFYAQMIQSSVFTFRNGLQELVNALYRNLVENENVDIKLESPVQSYKMLPDGEQQVEVTTGHDQSQTTKNFDLAISSLRTPGLTPTVTVMTVNLFYPKTNLTPVRGFGYLIPQSIPFEQNPERALGVIFDSDAVKGQDTADGTKLTVMLGGHWWNGWEHYPDSEEGLALAKSVIARHLGIMDEPVAHYVGLWKDCIPQYTVGYDDRLKEFAMKIRDEFRGRLRLVGNQYHGVGVNDSIMSAWSVARGLRGSGWKERGTGLDRALDERDWVVGCSVQPLRKEELGKSH